MGCSPCSNKNNENNIYNDIYYRNKDHLIKESSKSLVDQNTRNYKSLMLIKKKKTYNSNIGTILVNSQCTNSQLMKECKGTSSIFQIPIDKAKTYIRSNVDACCNMLKIINLARSNPKILIPKIEHLKEMIECDLNEYFLTKNSIKIRLVDGPSAFDNCIEFLQNNEKLGTLSSASELKFPILLDDEYDVLSKEYIQKVLKYKQFEIEKKYKILDFHYDLCYGDPELSALLQIIDDSNDNYQRRKNIFNPSSKYVGITEFIISDKKVCFYLIFAKKNNG